jgi:hypothetical protein
MKLTKLLPVQQTGWALQEFPLAPMTVIGEQVTKGLILLVA